MAQLVNSTIVPAGTRSSAAKRVRPPLDVECGYESTTPEPDGTWTATGFTTTVPGSGPA